MPKPVRFSLLFLLLLITAAAQRRFGGPPILRPNPSPVVAPAPPVPSHPISSPPVSAPPEHSFHEQWGHHGSDSRREQPPVLVPYGIPYPVYGVSQDAVGDGESGNADIQQPPPTMVENPVHPAPTNANVNACPSAPPLSQPVARPAPRDTPPLIYIALKDRWIHVAIAYWLENDTLHYITDEGHHNEVSLGLVDRKLSAKLNAHGAQLLLPER
jgi:hypothetical protein